MRLLLSFTKNALSRTEQREQQKQKTPLLSVVVYCGYDAVSKGSVYCACKSKQKDGFECEAFFPLNFSFFLLPFFLSINWAVFLRVSLLEWFTAARGDSYYVLLRFKRVGLRFSSALQSYKKFCASLSLSLSLFLLLGRPSSRSNTFFLSYLFLRFLCIAFTGCAF